MFSRCYSSAIFAAINTPKYMMAVKTKDFDAGKH